MQPRVAILIVSGDLENKNALRRILGNFPVKVFTAATMAQAQQALVQLPVSMVFCEERVSDGSYCELLEFISGAHQRTQFVVMLSDGEWNEYLEAIHFGAMDAVQCPLQATDVELVLIRAMRRNPPGASQLQAASTSSELN